MKLLQDIEDRGYPTDYLLARIRGRRVFFMSDWNDVLSRHDINEYLTSTHYGKFTTVRSAEDIRKRFLIELRWVYYQMNSKLRKVFQPYFIYSELDSLRVCLRYKSGKGTNKEIEQFLEVSLLSDKIKDILRIEADIPTVLYTLEKELPDMLAGLQYVFLTEGLKSAEQRITAALLEHIACSEVHPVISRFFNSIIDSKNVVTLYKHLRWETKSGPVYIGGGTINKSMLNKILHSYKTDELSHLVYKYTGFYIEEPDAANVEHAFLKSLTGQIKKWERECPDIGLILHYLWRCYIEAKNLSIISYGEKIDKNIIKEELVH